MAWVSRVLCAIFRCVPPEERGGITLPAGPCWQISPPRDLDSFLRALADAVPPDSVLYLECSSLATEIRLYLESRKIQPTTTVAVGTLWPRPHRFHIPVTRENIEGLAQLAERHAEPEVADHLHVYRNNQVLLQWYDAPSEPLYVSTDISEDKLKAFCTRLGTDYRPAVWKA